MVWLIARYLKMHYLQIECNRTAALDALFRQMFDSSHSFVALIESGCSVATEATAEVSHYYNITQVL